MAPGPRTTGPLHRDAGAAGVALERAMQDRGVRGVDAAFERLQPVALLPDLLTWRWVSGAWVHSNPAAAGICSCGPMIGPDDAAQLDRRIGRQPDFVCRTAPARSSARRSCRRRRISSRDRRSAARIPRCGRATARRGGAGRIRPRARCGRRCRGTRRAARRAAGRAPARQSGSGSSRDSSAGIQ